MASDAGERTVSVHFSGEGERTVPVHFSGEGSGQAPLTWAQRDHWTGIEEAGHAATFGGAFAMPDGYTVADAAEMLCFMVSRHQGLRSRFRFDGDSTVPVQVCSAEGTLELRVVDPGPADPAEVADGLVAEFRQRDFDFVQDWPVRMAVVAVGEAVSHLVIVYLHLAVDGGGAMHLQADLDARDPVTGAAAGPVTALQPLEQARSQGEPAAQRRSELALRHFEQVFRVAEPRLLGEPPNAGPPRYEALRYRSPITLPALGRIAVEQDVSLPTAMLSAFAIGLGRYIGHGNIWAMLLVGNRFRPGLVDSVTILVQSSPYLVDVSDVSLAEAVARTRGSLLQTYKNAYYDGQRRDEVVEQVYAERGLRVRVDCFYNDRLGVLPVTASADSSDDTLRAGLGTGSVREDYAGPALPQFPLYFNVDLTDGAVEFPVTYDARFFGVADIVRLAEEIERAAVETATTPQAPTGVGPAARVGTAAGATRG